MRVFLLLTLFVVSVNGFRLSASYEALYLYYYTNFILDNKQRDTFTAIKGKDYRTFYEGAMRDCGDNNECKEVQNKIKKVFDENNGASDIDIANKISETMKDGEKDHEYADPDKTKFKNTLKGSTFQDKEGFSQVYVNTRESVSLYIRTTEDKANSDQLKEAIKHIYSYRLNWISTAAEKNTANLKNDLENIEFKEGAREKADRLIDYFTGPDSKIPNDSFDVNSNNNINSKYTDSEIYKNLKAALPVMNNLEYWGYKEKDKKKQNKDLMALNKAFNNNWKSKGMNAAHYEILNEINSMDWLSYKQSSC